MKDGALVRGGYSVGCICDDEWWDGDMSWWCMAPLIIIHNTSRLQTCNRRDWNRWTIRHGETTQGLPWHRKFRQLSTLQGWVSNKLFGWCQMLPEVRPPFLFTSLVMNFITPDFAKPTTHHTGSSDGHIIYCKFIQVSFKKPSVSDTECEGSQHHLFILFLSSSEVAQQRARCLSRREVLPRSARRWPRCCGPRALWRSFGSMPRLGIYKGNSFEVESCEMKFDLFFASGGGTNAVGLEVGWNGIQCWEDFAGLCFRC